MKLYIVSTFLIIGAVLVAYSQSLSLEGRVILRAKYNPSPEAVAHDFLQGISKLTPLSIQDQGVYFYGMGIIHERQGNIGEAVMDYISGEIFGHRKSIYDLSSQNYHDEFALADPKIMSPIHTRFWEQHIEQYH